MAFRGINIATKRGASKPVIGFRGIVVSLQANLPVKVQDQRGRGLANVRVTISNPTSGVPSTGITDNQGNCIINADASNPNPVTVVRGNRTLNVNYTTGPQLLIVMNAGRFFPE